MRFREIFYGLLPSWAHGGDGERVYYCGGLLLDGFAQRMQLGLEASQPATAPEDALAYIGRDRGIRRGRNEPADAYAARVVQHLDSHATQGNPFVLMDQLYAYLQTPAAVLRTVDRRGNWFERAADGTRTFTLNAANWDWDGGELARWGRYWVLIFNGPWTAQWLHGTPGSVSTSGTTTATADEIATVRAIIAEWKPAGVRCEWIVVCFADPATIFGPATGDDPLGTWGVWAAGLPLRPVRSAFARYWKGEV